MLFDLDLEQSNRRSKSPGDGQTPCAPPPSPNFGSRRKAIPVPMLPLSKLFHSCEDLINRTSKISIGTKSPLHSKRKTSDMDTDSCSSSGSSPGSSSPDLSCSVGKRSRSSLDFDSYSFSVCLSNTSSRPDL